MTDTSFRDMQVGMNNTNKRNMQVEQVSLITSVALVNVCIALMFYVAGSTSPFTVDLAKFFYIFISIVYIVLLFSIFMNFGEMLKVSFDKLADLTLANIFYSAAIFSFSLMSVLLILTIKV